MTDNPEEHKMPLLDHLVELRRRLLYSLAGFVVIFIGCFFVADYLFNFLVGPLAEVWSDQEGRRLIYTALHEKFFTNVKVAFFTAAFLAFPLIAVQVWTFVAPGLYRNEKRAFVPFLVATPILFFAGGAFVFYMVLPVAWTFFASFEQLATEGPLAIQLEPKVNEYLSLTMRLIFAFGISFELPVAITLLARAGLATAEGLARKRRYAVVLAFVAGALLTPPDPISQLSLAAPIVLLYELSIWAAKLVERARLRTTEAAEAGE
ncbi:MAG: twin-arginine translocase subunit TatC [Alphaproteobacteria bacterium]